MSVLVYINSQNGSLSKAAREAVFYGSRLGATTVLNHGSASALDLGKYGAQKVLNLPAGEAGNTSLKTSDAEQITQLIFAAAEKIGAETIVISHDLTGRAVGPRLSAKLKAGLAVGAIALPDSSGKIKVNVFSGKAFGLVKINTPKRIISLTPNSVPIEESNAVAISEDFSADCGTSKISVLEVKKQEGEILLPEAELVVSAGRGMKGPENWGIVEALAKSLGAATACSRPVADIGWRPHHEHVGQTGIAIRPNLYIAIGISGAIQHLAGVNGSKVIVVINTDPEAPFFKAADYGVVGDAFEVLPKLTEEIKKFKSQN